MSDVSKLCVQLDKIVAEVESLDYVKEAGQFVRSQAVMLCGGYKVSSGELRDSIFMDFSKRDGHAVAEVYTEKSYAPYIEFGTGQKGAAHHAGISPNITPAYTLTPWWIHESMVDKDAAEVYRWFYIDTDEGRFYRVNGQPAKPFMYPALADNKDAVVDIMKKGIEKAFGGK